MKGWKLKVVLIFSTILFFMAGMMVVMIVAPGADILGLKYIRSTSGSIDSEQGFYTGELLDTDVVINCDNILVKVNFVQSYTFSVHLVDVYNGYCKSGDEPEVTMAIKEGIYTFDVNEYQPFVYHNRSDESALYINVPIYFTGRVIVCSRKSKVITSGLVGNLYGLTIETGGVVDIQDNLKTTDLNLVVKDKKVTISENAKIKGNLNIESQNANISCGCVIGGDISIKSKGGSLKFPECNNLTVEASNTEISSVNENVAKVKNNANITSNDDVTLNCLGDATITTKRGKVSLGETATTNSGKIVVTTKSGNIDLKGTYSGSVTIDTSSGDVIADWLKQAKITSVYGKVKSARVDDGEITTGGSGITILQSGKMLILKTRGGDIILGEKGKYFDASVKATTTAGKIVINNARGKEYKLQTASGDVDFLGSEKVSTKLTITSEKGFITAKNITDECTIKSTGKIDCTIVSTTATTTITGKSGSVSVTLPKTFVYELNSSKKENIYINDEQVGTETDDGGCEYITRADYKGADKLTITTNKGKITIKDR